MNKEYLRKVSNYKYEVLDYSAWAKYIREEYQKTATKNFKRKAKNTLEEIKNPKIEAVNFNW
tara:strand:+ start:12426 stop:12611 length:186 start_codon:yes stop_codon:yes gene_type:complete